MTAVIIELNVIATFLNVLNYLTVVFHKQSIALCVQISDNQSILPQNNILCMFLWFVPRSLCFQFLLPVIQICLMCLCIGGDPKGIDVAVVNNETSLSAYSRSLLSFLDNTSVYQVNTKFTK